MTTPNDSSPDDVATGTQADPQTHLDTDATNSAATPETEVDPAHDTGQDEGWTPAGGATPDNAPTPRCVTSHPPSR